MALQGWRAARSLGKGGQPLSLGKCVHLTEGQGWGEGISGENLGPVWAGGASRHPRCPQGAAAATEGVTWPGCTQVREAQTGWALPSHSTPHGRAGPDRVLTPGTTGTKTKPKQRESQSSISVHQAVQLKHKNYLPSHAESCRENKWPCDFPLPRAPTSPTWPRLIPPAPPQPTTPKAQGNKMLGKTLGLPFAEAESQVAKTNAYCLPSFFRVLVITA